mgnify:CR=1 FL=1
MIATDVLTPEVMGRLDGDAATARGLPGRAYGADFYELEQHQVFPKVWCTLALSSDVPNPGDVAPVELAGWPLLVVRDAAAEIRVFHNMCRHRAMRLVNEPCNVGDVLSCPWHAWRYGLDGSLLASPRLGGEREHRAAREPGPGPSSPTVPRNVGPPRRLRRAVRRGAARSR